MGRPMTPAEYAQAPPNDPLHPAVVDRLSDEMRATANALDAAAGVSFAADDPWDALQQLRESVEKLADEAELHRPYIA